MKTDLTADSLGKQLADALDEIDALRGNQLVLANQCAMLNLRLGRAHEYIKHAKYEKDYGCADCDPDGECVVPGFICAFHEAVE